MKKLVFLSPFLFLLSFLSLPKNVISQNVGIGTTAPHTSAQLEIQSSGKGVLLPRVGSAQRDAIASPAKGLILYDTTRSSFFYYDGNRWLPVSEKNYDSTIIDYSNAAVSAANLQTTSLGSFFTINSLLNSGFLYDNGGPAGNYSANNYSGALLLLNDTTVALKIIVEQMSAETSFDSLYLIPYDMDTGFSLDTIGLTGTQTGTYYFNSSIRIYFKANNTVQMSGFKIRWSRIVTNPTPSFNVPFYGWNFNERKIAVSGGLSRDNNWYVDSLGVASLSYGIGSKAKGKASYAFGYFTSATGPYAMATGNNTFASGQASIAMGTNSKATGPFSIAVGSDCEASGLKSMALGTSSFASSNFATSLGYICNASGDQSVAIGNLNVAEGPFSLAMGYSSIASGNYSATMGFDTKASGNFSTAAGYVSESRGNLSFALGMAIKSKSYAGFALGSYNDSTDAADADNFDPNNRIFQVGNGTANNARSNAMTVLQNGNVGIGILAPSQKLEVNGNIVVQNGKGIIRNTDGTQSKKLSTTVTVNTSFLAGETKTFGITWPETFSSIPEAFVGNIASGTGGWAEVIMTITNPGTTGATLWVYNAKNVTVNPNFSIKIIAIGPQ